MVFSPRTLIHVIGPNGIIFGMRASIIYDFFLEYARGLHIIALREELGKNSHTQRTRTHAYNTCL